ncbi:MAG: EamA family transporter [Hyphomicrobium sp.]|jgi:drug/metabolite transporter (DMT)-like permease
MNNPPDWLWIVFTLAAAVVQTGRIAMQLELTASLGTIGATHVRFLFGLPFSCLYVVLAALLLREPLPLPTGPALAWIAAAAISQCIGTALMLASMRDRSFVVTTALIKIEPVWVALMGVILLGEVVSFAAGVAILIATAGVLMVSWPRDGELEPGTAWKSAALGLAGGAFFGFTSIGYRAGIGELGAASYLVGAITALFVALFAQTLLMTVYIHLRERHTLVKIARAWRPSLVAGFMGSAASQFYFLAFALQSAALVRTLALIEILLAFAVARNLWRQKVTLREVVGIALLVAGVVVVING